MTMQGEIRPGYKQTEVGVIPEDWDAIRVDEIGTVKGGKRLPIGRSLTKRRTIHPYIRVSDMGNGTVASDEVMFVPEDVFPFIRNYRIFKTDLYISVAGTLGLVGRVPMILDGANLTENADRITDLKCDLDFLFFCLSSDRIQSEIQAKRTVGAQPKLAIQQIEAFEIAVPPTIEEQRAIAAALSDADALIAALEAMIAKKRDLKQAAMQHLLTGKTRLPGFSGEWEVKRLGEDATLKARIGWQGLTTAEYLDAGEFILVTGTEFNEGEIQWSECHFVDESRYKQDAYIQLKENDVLVTKDGTIGKVALVRSLPMPATLNSGVFVVRPRNDNFDQVFFYYVMTSRIFVDFLTRLTAGSTIVHLYQKDFVGFEFKAPPTLTEQTAIAEVLSDMDADLAALEAQAAKARAVKQGMMQELLTGKVRLV